MTERDESLTPAAFEPTANSVTPDRLAAAQFEPLSQATPRQKRLPLRQMAMAIIGLLFAVVLLFLFTARSLTLNIEADSEVTYDLDGLHWSFGDRLLVRPGDYGLEISAEGYHPYAQTITVGDADSQQIDIQLAPLPGVLAITTQPAGATLTVNTLAVGTSPATDLVLEAGTYAVTAQLERYQSFQQEITVTGRNQSQTLDIALAPDWAQVAFTTIPTAASATVDNEPAAITANGVDVLSGDHTLTLSAPGFLPENIALSIVAGVDEDLGTITLTPADATLTLASEPSGASVTVDGAFTGLTPLVVPLSPNQPHVLQLSKAGFESKTLRLSLTRGEIAQQSIALTPELGEVRFTLEPPDAELIINGRGMGLGSQILALPAVTQRIEIRLAGYASYEASVLPRPGLAQQVNVTLLTEAAARKAAMTPTITTSLGQTLVLIDPAAESQNPFTMGASRRDPGRRANEVEHAVELKRAFYLASTETTNAQFRQFEASHDSGLIESYSLDRDHQPVAGVTWQQAASFCNWLSLRAGLAPFYREQQGIIIGFNSSSVGYRLPSEAEWAFAARVEGDQLRRFAWGDTFPPTQAVTNVADNTSALVTGRILNGYTDQFVVSAPVSSFPPNHRGLYDMGGNVAEWIHDGYRIPSANAELAIDPLGAQRGDNYTIRGGSWALSRLSELRLTFRDYGERGRDDLGFRIARYAE